MILKIPPSAFVRILQQYLSGLILNIFLLDQLFVTDLESAAASI